MSQRLIFLDTETTGLDSERHEVWEIAWIVRDPGSSDVERWEQLPPERFLAADPYALRIGRYWERRASTFNSRGDIAAELALTFDGATVVGAVPDFDVRFLTRFLNSQGYPWTAHYHLCDVENLAVGYLAHAHEVAPTALLGPSPLVLEPPWDSEALSKLLGVFVPVVDRHTALGDARWARDIYDAVMGER